VKKNGDYRFFQSVAGFKTGGRFFSRSMMSFLMAGFMRGSAGFMHDGRFYARWPVLCMTAGFMPTGWFYACDTISNIFVYKFHPDKSVKNS